MTGVLAKPAVKGRSMSHDARKFVALCLTGLVRADEIDDFVDQWHASDSEESLPQFLGLTDEEYALWVEKPRTLQEILQSRANDLSLLRIAEVPH